MIVRKNNKTSVSSIGITVVFQKTEINVPADLLEFLNVEDIMLDKLIYLLYSRAEDIIMHFNIPKAVYEKYMAALRQRLRGIVLSSVLFEHNPNNLPNQGQKTNIERLQEALDKMNAIQNKTSEMETWADKLRRKGFRNFDFGI